MIPVVIYKAKSTTSTRLSDSLGSQETEIRARVAQEGGREVVAVYGEENVSAYHAGHVSPWGFNVRGPQLEAAMRHVASLSGGSAKPELYVAATDRLARGNGMDSGHLIEFLLWALKNGVQIRSVSDDSAATDLLYGFINGMRNTEDSRVKALHVARGIAQVRSRGRRVGGPVPDGYRGDVTRDSNGRVASRTILIDEKRAPLVRRVFDLSEQGYGDATIARMVNAEGWRTIPRRKKVGENQYIEGKPTTFSRNRIQSLLYNPAYKGVYRVNEQVDGEAIQREYRATDMPEPIIDAARYDRILGKRRERDASRAGREKGVKGMYGKLATRFLLQKLGRCARCGGTMYCRTEPKPRADGTRKRWYSCAEIVNATGDCTMPRIDAEVLDAAFLPHIRVIFEDYEAWAKRVNSETGAQREQMEAHLASLQAKLAKAHAGTEAAAERVADYMAEGEIEKADAMLSAVTKAKRNATKVEREIENQFEEVANLPVARADTLSTFWGELAATILTGERGDNLLTVNLALHEVLDHVALNVVGAPAQAASRIEVGSHSYKAHESAAIVAQPVHRLADRMLASIETPAAHGALPGMVDPDGGLWVDTARLASNRTAPLGMNLVGYDASEQVGDVASMPVEVGSSRPASSRWEPWHWGFVGGC